MATVINAGRFASGNATQLQSIPVLQQTPTPGQVLKADAQSNWAPGTDSDSANAVTLQNRALAATAPTDGQVIKWDNAGRFASGNATQLQSIPVLQQTPTPGQVLKADAQSNWAPGTDSDSANAVTLQNRALAATAPTDGQVIKWDNAGNTWKPDSDETDTNATQIQGVDVAPTSTVAPQDAWALKYNLSQTRWEPSPDNNSQDATHIRNIPVDSVAPTATKTTLTYDSTAAEYVADYGAGVISDGSRSYVKDLTENLGVGTAGPGLSGKIHAYNTGNQGTRIVAESQTGPASIHLRSNADGTAATGDQYAQVQFWDDGATRAQIHWDGVDRELVYTADGSANSSKGIAVKDDGRTGFHLNEGISNFTVKTIADTATLLGMDGGIITTNVSTTTLTANNPGSVASGFLKLIGVGDRVSVSTAASVFATVVDVVSDTVLTLDNAIGDGTATQTITLKRAIASFVDSSNVTQAILSDRARLGIGTKNPQRKLHVATEAGEGNSTIILESPDDQAVLSLRADQTGVASGTNKDPSINFQSGTGPGELARLRYYADYDQLGLVLKDSPVVNDKVTVSASDTLSNGTSRGVRVGIRQERAASGLSAKGLPTGQLMGNDDLAVTATPDLARLIHTVSANGDPMQRLALGDRVAIATTLPLTDTDYAYVSEIATGWFGTSTPLGVTGVANNVWLKPAHFRLEDATTTQDVLLVDSEGRGRFGVDTGGLDGTLSVNGYVSLTDENVLTAPPLDDAGAVQDVTKLYFQKGNGNDSDMRCLLHFDTDGPHGFLSDAGFGSTQRHTITNKPGLVDVDGVVVDNSTTKFGTGSAYFGGDSYLNIDEMFGGGTDFDPNAGPGYSWSFWLNLQTATATIQPLTGVYYTAAKWSHLVFDEAADTLYLKQDFDDGVGTRTSAAIGSLGISLGATPIGMGTWFYLAVVYEKSSNKLYVFVNGILKGSDTLTAAAPNAFVDIWKNTAIRIGFDQGYSDSKFKGHMDEVAYSAKVRHTTAFVNPTEAFRATGLYAWHGGLSQPYRLQPVGS